MLTVHRRHDAKCKDSKGLPTAELDKCVCPLMVMGVDCRGHYHNREALHTRDKFIAHRIVREIEDGKIERPQPVAEEWTIEKSLSEYRRIMGSQRGWSSETIIGHEHLHRTLLAYAAKHKIKFLREITTSKLMDWVAGWELANSTKAVRTASVKKLFDMAWRIGWIKENPAIILEAPKFRRMLGSTEPFDLDSQLPRIIDAIPHWEDGLKFVRRWGMSIWAKQPRTASALLLVLRWTGLRISDALTFNPSMLERRKVDGREMYCHFARKQKKTDKPVFVPLFPEDIEPIFSAPRISEQYMFWDGETPLRDWNNLFHANCLRYLERVSGVPNIHPHRFRDTFAVDLLNKKVDIRAVSRLLGHSSPATTLKYYEHFLPGDQDNLIRSVMNGREAEGNVIKFPGERSA